MTVHDRRTRDMRPVSEPRARRRRETLDPVAASTRMVVLVGAGLQLSAPCAPGERGLDEQALASAALRYSASRLLETGEQGTRVAALLLEQLASERRLYEPEVDDAPIEPDTEEEEQP